MPQRKCSKLKIDILLIFWYVLWEKENIDSKYLLFVVKIRYFNTYNNSLVLLLQVIVNPKLKSTSKRTALFFEGCLRYIMICPFRFSILFLTTLDLPTYSYLFEHASSWDVKFKQLCPSFNLRNLCMHWFVHLLVLSNSGSSSIIKAQQNFNKLLLLRHTGLTTLTFTSRLPIGYWPFHD